MIKVTNIQATRLIGALLILLSGNAFAVTYATQPALNTEISNRKAADTTETARATKAEGTVNKAIATETARAKAAEGTLNKAIAAETARAKAAEAAATCTPYHWGDTGPDGGKVFYVDGSGCHGLEAQPYDVAADSQKPYDGKPMSWENAILTAAAYNITTITGPSGLNCSTTAFPATPNCWHLPSKNELSWLYEQKSVVGGFASSFYWSSTETNSTNAWLQNFTIGSQNYYYKYFTYRVRAVRAF